MWVRKPKWAGNALAVLEFLCRRKRVEKGQWQDSATDLWTEERKDTGKAKSIESVVAKKRSGCCCSTPN